MIRNDFYLTLLLMILLFCLLVKIAIETYPTNGEEPDYQPDKWVENQTYNNCYAYALDNLKVRHRKPQPAEQPSPIYTCQHLKQWIDRDLIDQTGRKYSLLAGQNEQLCPKGHHQIYLVHNEDDYHFYRLDSDGLWSHKPGSSEVTRLDGNGELITNPSMASHNYNNFNYDRQCGFLCVPKIEEKW